MLVLGSQSGLLFGTLYYRWFPNVAQNPTALDVVGRRAFFTAVVRAPVTGIILVTEMTGKLHIAFAIAQRALRGNAGAEPAARSTIYDSLRQRTLKEVGEGILSRIRLFQWFSCWTYVQSGCTCAALC